MGRFSMSCPGVCRRTWTCRVVVATVIILVFIALALGATMVILRIEKSSIEETCFKKDKTEMEEVKRHYRTYPVPPPRDKVYLISVGDDFGGIESRGEEGQLIGLAQHIIPLVCIEAGVNCEMVYSTYDECWQSGGGDLGSSGGRGLMGRWFDSCFGWFVTLQRIAVFSFGKAILQREKAFFFHKRKTVFDPQNIIGKKIGFISSWAMNVNCIRNKKNIAGANIPKNNTFHYDTNEAGILALEKGEIDALFAAWVGVQKLLKQRDIVHSNYVINCLLEGSAVMSKKGSDFPAHWNVGFQKLRSSGKFRKLCHSARIQYLHLGSYSCIDEDVI